MKETCIRVWEYYASNKDSTLLQIVNDAGTNPWIRIIVLVEVPYGLSSKARDGRIRSTEDDMVLAIEKVGRVTAVQGQSKS